MPPVYVLNLCGMAAVLLGLGACVSYPPSAKTNSNVQRTIRIPLDSTTQSPPVDAGSSSQKTLVAATDAPTSPITSESGPLPDPLAAGWQGRSVCEQLELTAKQRVLRCTFPPGVGHERHFHAPHVGYALSGGTMQLIDERGTRVVELKTGSHFASGGTAWHEVLNVGTTTVQYLIVEPL